MRIGSAEIKGFIFDMDGTLLDSMPEWIRTAEIIAGRYGIVPDAEFRRTFMTLPASDAAEFMRRRYCVSVSGEEIDAEIEAAYLNRIMPKPHTMELLEYLRKNNIKSSAATATVGRLAAAAFERTGILPYLERIVSCEDVGKSKSEPDVYYAAAKLMQTETAETAVVEDALYAVVTAKKAGFTVIGIEDESMFSDRQEIMNTADLYIKDASEIYRKE